MILRYQLSGHVLPHLKEWMMEWGISLDQKSPSQVGKINKDYYRELKEKIDTGRKLS